MKKALIIILSVCCLACTAMFFACGDKVTIGEFEVDDSVKYVEVGENYSVPKISAKDSKGNFIVPELSVKDPSGAAVTVTDYKFTPAKIGNYTVQYTVTVGETTETKSFTLEVYDSTKPEVDIDLEWYNITVLGTSFDTKTITATDNSGETVTPEVSVKFNDEEVTLDNGVVTFDEKGTYKIHVYCEDSSGNFEDRDYVVWTEITYEDDVFVENQWYANQTSDKHARHGEKAMEIALFQNNTNWFNDESVLGNIFLYGNTTEKPFTHVSYWIYFDFAGIEVTKGSASVNSIWYDMDVYDIYGESVAKNSMDKYEFMGDTWYRVVADLTAPQEGVTDHPDVAAITENLNNYGIFLGLWDFTAGSNNFAKGPNVYIDDIRIIDPAADDEVYDTPPEPPKPAKEYDVGERLAMEKYSDMVWKVGGANGEAQALKKGEETLVEYDFKHGTVEGTMSKFTVCGNQQLDSADSGVRAHSSGWQIIVGSNDGFIYEIKAAKTVYVKLQAQVKDVDESENNMAGWLDKSAGHSLNVYIVDAEGNRRTVYSYTPDGASGVDENGKPTGFEVGPVLLEAGETLLYEYNFPYSDERNIQNPPYICIYEAVEKVSE